MQRDHGRSTGTIRSIKKKKKIYLHKTKILFFHYKEDATDRGMVVVFKYIKGSGR